MVRGPLRWTVMTALLISAACGGGGGDAGTDASGASDAGPDGRTAVVTAAQVCDPGVVRRFELTIAPADWEWLQAHARDEQYVPADLRYGEVTVGRIGVRYKGAVGSLALCFDASGNRTCPKLSMKLHFDEYVDGQRFAGLEHLAFHAMSRDPSQMKDRLGYGLFRAAGVPAPRAVHARLVINGADQGLFALVEQIDGELVEDHFRAIDGSGEGNLYKEVWPVATTPEPYRAALETNRDASVDRMVRFATAIGGATPATFRATMASWTDLPTLVSYLAVDRLIDHWDGIVGWYCPDGAGTCFNHNYYWYEEVGRDRVWLIPWDLDLTMQVPSPIRSQYGMPDWNASTSDCALRRIFLGLYGRPPACDQLIGLMAQVLWPDYQARTAELLAGPASPAALDAEIAAMEALLAPEVASDPFGPGMNAWRAAVADLRADLTALRARVAP
jgi:hypothetical protein